MIGCVKLYNLGYIEAAKEFQECSYLRLMMLEYIASLRAVGDYLAIRLFFTLNSFGLLKMTLIESCVSDVCNILD